MYRVLDHYYIRLRNNCYAVATGNTHYNSGIIGYVKYCPSSRKTQWCRGGICYERLVPVYDPTVVYASTQTTMYAPYYGSKVPFIPFSMITKIYDPVVRVRELLMKPMDRLETVTIGLISELMSTGCISGIGVTGSLLAGIHNPVKSDIDLVIYDWRTSIGIIESINENSIGVKAFNNYKLREWCRRNAEMNNISIEAACKYYRPWRRGVYNGREYSIIYNSGVYKPMETMEKWDMIGLIKVKAYIGGGLDGLNYPSKGLIDEYRVIQSTKPLKSNIEYVLSFEALYIPLLYEGGWALINGLLQYSWDKDSYRVVLGVKEYKGSMIWL